MKTWKRREKQVAAAFGVKRNLIRNQDYRLKAPDTTEHELFSIEIKERSRLPKYLDMGNNHYKVLMKNKKFITDSINQAMSYHPQKIPLAVFCEKHKKIDNAVVCIRAGDFYKYDDRLNLWNEEDVLCYRLGIFIHKYEYLWTNCRP